MAVDGIYSQVKSCVFFSTLLLFLTNNDSFPHHKQVGDEYCYALSTHRSTRMRKFDQNYILIHLQVGFSTRCSTRYWCSENFRRSVCVEVRALRCWVFVIHFASMHLWWCPRGGLIFSESRRARCGAHRVITSVSTACCCCLRHARNVLNGTSSKEGWFMFCGNRRCFLRKWP